MRGGLSFLEVLRVRNFRLMWIGESISLLGDQFYLIALPWLVLQLTGNALAMGAVLALAGIPRALLIVISALGMGLALLGLVTSTAVAAIVALLMGAANGYVVILFMTWLQSRTPQTMPGRMMSLLMLAAVGLNPPFHGALRRAVESQRHGAVRRRGQPDDRHRAAHSVEPGRPDNGRGIRPASGSGRRVTELMTKAVLRIIAPRRPRPARCAPRTARPACGWARRVCPGCC